MNYKIGDKITIKSRDELKKLDFFNDVHITYSMLRLASKRVKIWHWGHSNKYKGKYIKIEEDNHRHTWYPWMFKKKAIWI